MLGLNDTSLSTAEVTAKERELRRTAQKGVIKLFNAVRAAQVKGELAEQQAKDQSLVGMAKREEKVKEMSKLIQSKLDEDAKRRNAGGLLAELSAENDRPFDRPVG